MCNQPCCFYRNLDKRQKQEIALRDNLIREAHQREDRLKAQLVALRQRLNQATKGALTA